MEIFNCLIVDDEPIARDIVQTYCDHLYMLNVVGCCENAMDAKLELQKQKVDIIFLDINMPVLDGIAFLKTLKVKPQVIFTTAYKEFALDAFDLSVCDYLLKPFSLERFIIAVDKAIERLQIAPKQDIVKAEIKEIDHLFIKADGKIYKIFFDDLLFAEASGNYTKLVTNQQTLLPNITFTGFETMLPPALFLRVHRSFIINKDKITHIEGNRIFVGKHEIAIGSNYRDDLFKKLGML